MASVKESRRRPSARRDWPGTFLVAHFIRGVAQRQGSPLRQAWDHLGPRSAQYTQRPVVAEAASQTRAARLALRGLADPHAASFTAGAAVMVVSISWLCLRPSTLVQVKRSLC